MKNRPFLPILSGFPGFSEGAILQASERQTITKSGITSVFCSHSPVADFRKSYEHRFVNIYTPREGRSAAGFLLFSLVGAGCSEAGGRLSPVGVRVGKRKLIKD